MQNKLGLDDELWLRVDQLYYIEPSKTEVYNFTAALDPSPGDMELAGYHITNTLVCENRTILTAAIQVIYSPLLGHVVLLAVRCEEWLYIV